jgi:HEAT repeat protein
MPSSSSPTPSPPASPPDPAAEARRRKNTLILTLVAAATILVPFLFWKQTWFGEPLNADQIAEYLADREHPRHQQQALVQIQQRIEQGDRSVERWFPQIIALKDEPVVELRVTLAWMLGADNHSEAFHQALLALLADNDLLVRRNAALSLVRFGDTSGHNEILLILQPTIVFAAGSGVVDYRAKEGGSVERNEPIAQLTQAAGLTQDIYSSVPGRLARRTVADGASVTSGQELAVIAPGEDHVWEALRALLLIGRPEDIPRIEPFAYSSDADYTAKIRQQAALTLAEIKARAATASADTNRPRR